MNLGNCRYATVSYPYAVRLAKYGQARFLKDKHIQKIIITAGHRAILNLLRARLESMTLCFEEKNLAI